MMFTYQNCLVVLYIIQVLMAYNAKKGELIDESDTYNINRRPEPFAHP